MRDEDDDSPEYDAAVIMGDGSPPFDLTAAVDMVLASATEIAQECGANSHAEVAMRAQEMLLVAAACSAHANGLTDEAFGEAMVEAFEEYDCQLVDPTEMAN